MTLRPLLLALCALVPTTTPLTAQAAPAQATAPAARPADVATEDAILAALYDVISGPAGQKRDWDRMRSLFQPGARLIPTFRAQDGSWQLRNWTVEEYITTAGALLHLTELVYGRRPVAALQVEIPAYEMGFGEELSPWTATWVGRAIARLAAHLGAEPRGRALPC